jgi:hypothetical protein
MGEKQNQPFQLSSNPSWKVDFQGSRVTSDSGLLLVRELDEHLGLSSLIAEHLTGDRRKKVLPVPPNASDAAGTLGESGSRTSGTLLCLIE